MNRVYSYILIIAISTTSSFAAPLPPNPPVPDYAKAQSMLDEYARKTNPTVEDGVTIGVINAVGLQPTSANVMTVQRLLSRTAQRETKIRLIRLLGSLYTYDNASSQNVVIANSLKGHISSGDAEVARTALYAYSRIAAEPDWVDVLDLGLRKGILTEDSYSQELALGVAVAPARVQIAAASRLAAKNSAFGAQVLAMSFNDKINVEKVAPEARETLIGFLLRQEPIMPMAIGQYSIGAGLTYARWLESLALFMESAGHDSYSETVLTHLNAPNADPRNILGYLTSPQGRQFMKLIGQRSMFVQASAKAIAFTKQFPSNRQFSGMRELLEKSLGELPQ
jgi:hypothetical protein